jgi:hypothetical protein
VALRGSNSFKSRGEGVNSGRPERAMRQRPAPLFPLRSDCTKSMSSKSITTATMMMSGNAGTHHTMKPTNASTRKIPMMPVTKFVMTVSFSWGGANRPRWPLSHSGGGDAILERLS